MDAILWKRSRRAAADDAAPDGNEWGITRSDRAVVRVFWRYHNDPEDTSGQCVTTRSTNITLKKRGYKATPHAFQIHYQVEGNRSDLARLATPRLTVVLDGESE